jgi:hypothetical protein
VSGITCHKASGLTWHTARDHKGARGCTSARDLTILSARVGNYQFHPYWNLLIDQLWVR